MGIKLLPFWYGNFFLAGLLFGSRLFAQNDTLKAALKGSIKEIVITGTSPDLQWKDNPALVRNVSQEAIEQTTEDNLLDALVKNVPGFESVKTGPNVSKPFIHGLGYNRIETSYDGIPIENQTFEDEEVCPVDQYNVERAQVLLGPTTLMYGPDALAGLVSLYPFMTRDTDHIVHGRYLNEYQTNNGLIGNGLNLSYGNKDWAIEVRGSSRIAKNYSNEVDGLVYNTGFDESNGSASIVHKTKNGFSGLHFTIYDDQQGIPDGSRDSLTRQFTYPIFDDPNDNIKDRPIVPESVLNAYPFSPIHQHIQHYRLYTTNHYDLKNKSAVDVLISLQQNNRREYDYPELPLVAGVSNRLRSLNYDLRYTFPRDSIIETIAGTNGMFQNNSVMDATDIPIPDYNLFDAGGFVFTHIQHGKWNICGGLRADARFVSGTNFYVKEDTAAAMVKQVTPPDTAGAHLLFPAFNKIFTGLSADLGATYQLNQYINLKANLSRGSGAPGVNEFASNGLDASAHAYYIGQRNIDPEQSLQEDIGANFISRDIDANVSVFNNNLQDYSYLIEVLNPNGTPEEIIPGNKTYEYAQSPAQLYGIESFLNLHPHSLKGFSFGNYFSLVYGYNRSEEYKDKGVEGEYLPLIPPMKLMSSVNQQIRIKNRRFPLLLLKAEVEIDGAQNRYLGLNGTETATPGYTLVNAAAVFTIHYSRKAFCHLQFQVNNLFNVAYQSNLSRLKYFEYYSYSPNGHYGIYNMGRNFILKLIIPF